MAPREKKEDLLIINRRTGKALQATGTENGLVVEQAVITGGDAQLWTPVKADKNVKLLNKFSGKVLDVMHGGTEAGSWAQTWEDVDGESQLWQLVKVTATYSKLLNVHSGKVLDIVDMREDDGAPAQIWDDVDGAGQQWKLAEPKSIKALAAKVEAEEALADDAEPAPKKRPGRKPQAAPAVEEKAEPAPAASEAEGPAPKKRPGRKQKAQAAKAEEKAPAAKKRPGRKPKTQA